MPSQVIILGMHRSGTSLAGQVLEALGFHFGPQEKAAAPKKDNPLGYWERTDIGRLNDRVFAAQGATWEKIDAWKPERLSSEDLQKFEVTAREIIAGYPKDKPCFIKDPRICLTLPLWEKHLNNPVFLIVYRDPVEISRSLWSRNQYPPRLVMALWERYLGDALNATRGKKRLLLRYPDLIREPESTIRNLVAGLRQAGVEPPNSLENALDKIKVDSSLRHHTRNSRELEISFTESQQILHGQLLNGTALEQFEEINVSEANRQIRASREIVDLGKTHPLSQRGDSPGEAESFARLLQEIRQTPSDKIDIIALTNRFLEASRAFFTETGRDAMAALEAIHLLTFHLHRTKTFKVGGDYALATMAVWCDALSRRFPMSNSLRKPRRAFRKYHGRLPGTLAKAIRRSGRASGKQWVEMLNKAGDAATALLSDYAMGKLPLLPEITGDTLTSLERYQASLATCTGQIQKTLSALDSLRAHLEKSLIGVPPGTDEADASTEEADVAKMLEWGEKLCRTNPFSITRYKAVKEYRAYRAKTGELGVRDAERFQRMTPAVNAALQRLEHLLKGVEQVIVISESIRNLACQVSRQ